MANKLIREPKQSRSINLKEKILDTALKLFCEKGFYKTTTNEIAKTADVSIGSLYSYFKDKDTIFFEIMDRYHKQFITLHSELKPIDFNTNKREWLRNLCESLIAIHETFKEFNRELNVLYYSNPEVAAFVDQQREESRQIVFGYFSLWNDELKVDDLEATAVVTYDFISTIIDRIVFEKDSIDKGRILDAGISAISKYLFE